MTVATADIQRAVCAHYDLTLDQLRADTKARRIAWPRQLGMYLTHRLTPRSNAQIAHAFGRRDHTTAMHAIAAVKERIRTDPEYSAETNAVLRLIATQKTEKEVISEWICLS